MGKSTYFVYLPLEVFGRELDGKLLLAAELASRGLTVVLGHKTVVKKYALDQRRRGVWYALACREKEAKFARRLSEYGIVSVAQDEEAGTIYEKYSDFHRLRADHWHISDFSAFFCWGEDDYNFLCDQYPNDALKIYNTGSPRSALLGELGRNYYSDEIGVLKDKYGDFVLFVSGFQYGNGHVSQETRGAIGRSESIWARNSGDQLALLVEEERKLMRAFSDAIQLFAHEVDANVVLRPHPCENKEFWEAVAKPHSRVRVASDRSATPWILSSGLIIQNSSTVGLEACLCGTPAVAFSSSDVGFFRQNKRIPDLVMPRITSSDELVEYYRGLSGPTMPPSAGMDIAKKKISFSGTGRSVMKQADIIEGLCQDIPLRVSRDIAIRLYHKAKHFIGPKVDISVGSQNEINKRPEIHADYIRFKLPAVRRILSISSDLKITGVGKSTFIIQNC